MTNQGSGELITVTYANDVPRLASGNSNSNEPVTSGDGRFVVFSSSASNLVPDDTNGVADIFIRDLWTGAIRRVSIAQDGSEGDRDAWTPSVSADGRFVSFISVNNKLSGDQLGNSLYLKDMQTGELKSVNGFTQRATLSADGQYLIFDSLADSLVSGDTNSANDVFAMHVPSGAITRVSADAAGQQANGYSYSAAISVNGRYVAFVSDADNLVPGDNNGQGDIFLKDLVTGDIKLVSRDAYPGGIIAGQPVRPSDDGRFVVYIRSSGARSLLLRKDLQTGVVDIVSDDGRNPSMSADGRFIAFDTSQKFGNDLYFYNDVFVKDMETGILTCVSRREPAQEELGYSGLPSMSADGRIVYFASEVPNFSPHDGRRNQDIFVWWSNQAPVLQLRQDFDYKVGSAAVLIDPAAAVSDVDSFDWENAQLTVAISGEIDSSDRLEVVATENIELTPFDIIYQGRTVANVVGNGTSHLKIYFLPGTRGEEVQEILRHISFRSLGENSGDRQLTITLTDGNGGTSAAVNIAIDVMRSHRPVIDNIGDARSFVENSAPVVLAPTATVSDVDSPSFKSGQLVVQFTTAAESTDRLAIRSAGDLVVSGQELKFKDILIGTFTGGVGTEPLVVTFNEKASPFRAQMVLRNVTYRSLSERPSDTPRELAITLTDGDGGMSSPVSKTITVSPVNDAPKLNTALSPTLTAINENNRNAWGTPVWTLLQGYSDVDAGALKGLAITSASGRANGAWQYTLDGGATWLDLGAVSLSSAKLLPALGNLSRVRFVPNANFHGTVQLGYFAWDQTQGSAGGTFDLSGSGKFGGTTAFGWGYETASLTVKPVNTPPRLTLPSAPVGYVLNSPAVLLASTATLKDPDSVQFVGGWLKVEISAGADVNDRLSIGGPFTVVDGNLIWNNQATIGTVQGGVGSEALMINLNANATRYRVELLVRSIKFGTLGSSKTGLRTVAFSVSDGTSDSNVATLDVQIG